ncbi:MAG: signal peptidase I [Dehalococcoidales bacterium]|nr:signal peptidase I [Dehalococcoidales bacterium]
MEEQTKIETPQKPAEKQAQVKPQKRHGKATRIVTWIITGILLLFIAGLLFVYASPDYGFYYVKTGSMKPAINPGDIVITGPVGGWLTGELEVGKVITYMQGDVMVTHRIVKIREDGALTTKGDANEDPDPLTVLPHNVDGIYMFKIPLVGYISGFVSNRSGWFLVIIIPAIVLVLFLVRDIIKEAFKASKKGNKDTKGGEVYQGVQKNDQQDKKETNT